MLNSPSSDLVIEESVTGNLPGTELSDPIISEYLKLENKDNVEEQKRSLELARYKLMFEGDDIPSPSDENLVIEIFSNTFLSILGQSDNYIVDSIKSGNKIEFSETVLIDLLRLFNSIDNGRYGEIGHVRNRSYVPKIIEKYRTFNCSGASIMFGSIAKRLGWDVFACNPNGHATNILKVGGKVFYIDPRNNLFYEISQDIGLDYSAGKRIGIIKLRNSIPSSGFTILPYYKSLADANSNMSYGNHREMLDEGGDVYKEQKDGVEEVKRTTNIIEEFELFQAGKLDELEAYQKSDERQNEEKGINNTDKLISALNLFGVRLNEVGVSDYLKQLDTEILFSMIYNGVLPEGISLGQDYIKILGNILKELYDNVIMGLKQINSRKLEIDLKRRLEQVLG